MQIKFISSVLLASTALIPTILASASPAPAPVALAAANPVPVPNANPIAKADAGDVGDKIDELLDNIGDKIDDTVEKVKDTTSKWVEELKSWDFPSIKDIPEDIKAWFNDAKQFFKDFPEEAWEEIKKGAYPPEVKEWIESLPEKMRDEAREELREWAAENDAVSNLRGLSYGFVGIAGVAVVMLSF